MTKFLQSQTDSTQNWCLANGMKLSRGKTMIISFIHKLNHINFSYKLCNDLASSSQHGKKSSVDLYALFTPLH